MRRKRTRAPNHPGQLLKRLYLEPKAITTSKLARTLGISRKTMSKIINGRGAVSVDMALRLSQAFNTSAELWLNLQRNYDLWHVARSSTGWRKVERLAA